MAWLFAVLTTFLIFGLGNYAMKRSQTKRRRLAASVPQGEQLLLEARDRSARVFVSQSVLAGPAAGKINVGTADLLLTSQRLVVATHQGRVLELVADKGGSVRQVGPGRLVIEGERARSKGSTLVRVELLMDNAEQWSQLSHEHLHTTKSAG